MQVGLGQEEPGSLKAPRTVTALVSLVRQDLEGTLASQGLVARAEESLRGVG